jgi:hypothetical protein
MKCNCGYKGQGNVVDKDKRDAGSFWECPKCKSSGGIRNLTGIDVVMRAIFEDNARVAFTQGSILKSADGQMGMNYSVEQTRHDSNGERQYKYGWISIEEYRWLKKWAMQQNIFDKYCEEFAMTDCTICKKDIDLECPFMARRLLGECRGKIHETISEGSWRK